MTTIYRTDAAGYFTGETFTVTDPFAALPQGVTTEPPALTGTQVAQWIGSKWIVMDERPVPPVPVPAAVSRFQARMALRAAGLFDAVETMMANPATPIAAVEAWQTAQEFRRQSPTILAMAQALNLTEQQLDDLFIAAGQIEA